jgi:hypothetical protein
VRQPDLVQGGVYDAFTKRLAETAGAMKVAEGFEPGAVIGPLIDMKAVEKVEAHIADAVKKGAKVVTGGKRAAQGGSFFEPTVLTDVTTDMVITKGKTFGPVAPLYRFKTEGEAVKMANDAPTLPPPLAGEGGEGAASGGSPRRWNTASLHQRGHHLAETPGEIAGFGGSNRPPAFSLAGVLKRPTFPSPRRRSHTRRPPMHLLGW